MLLSEAVLRQLDAFSLAVREHAQGAAGGMRRARSMGSSVEFSDFRQYVPGDDPRRVDWNAYARFEKLFIKLFLDEQETTLRLLIDASGSMRYGEPDKWAQTLKVAAALAYLALSRYDRVALAALQEGGAVVSRSFAGRAAYPAVETFLMDIVPGGDTRLNDALKRVPIAAGRGLCVLISDLLTDGWETGIASLLYRRQQVSVLQLMAPEELSPDLAGALRLIDSEGGPSCDVQVSADVMNRYQTVLQGFLAERAAFCQKRGIAYGLIHSGMALEGELLKALARAGVILGR